MFENTLCVIILKQISEICVGMVEKKAKWSRQSEISATKVLRSSIPFKWLFFLISHLPKILFLPVFSSLFTLYWTSTPTTGSLSLSFSFSHTHTSCMIFYLWSLTIIWNSILQTDATIYKHSEPTSYISSFINLVY